MSRLRLDLAYDGTGFHGWQFQPGVRTVQGTLEAALSRLAGGRPVRVRAAGRTDAGAHARQQVADCELESRLDDDGLCHALARILPADLRPLRVRRVPASFHSQLDACVKEYRYRLDRTAVGDPFLSRYALHHPARLDTVPLRDALARLRGEHDWSGFADSRCRVRNRVRTLHLAEFRADGPDAWFRFRADGFLTYMVRNIVGTLLAVASNRAEPGCVDEILTRRDRRLAAAAAPAHGLCLWCVEYPAESPGERRVASVEPPPDRD